jgi:hypothetical protein
LDIQRKEALLGRAKAWFRDEFAVAHIANTEKLANLDAFNVNPFLWRYMAQFLSGDEGSLSLARALVLPRVLGSSPVTSFGTRIQKLITQVVDGVQGSQIPGMDIEFIDQVDGRRKFCQLKAGPNVINKPDVIPIKAEFQKAINLARTNGLPVQQGDYVFGLVYGDQSEINNFIRDIARDYTVYVGKEFWHHITGFPDFYDEFIDAIADIAEEFDGQEVLEETIKKLAKDIEKRGFA